MHAFFVSFVAINRFESLFLLIKNHNHFYSCVFDGCNWWKMDSLQEIAQAKIDSIDPTTIVGVVIRPNSQRLTTNLHTCSTNIDIAMVSSFS